jgi:hypothetical protein
MKLYKINKEQQSFTVMMKAGGFINYKFDYVDMIVKRLAEEMSVKTKIPRKGTKNQYGLYRMLIEQVHRKHGNEHYRSSAGLNPKLVGYEGKRIEVVYKWGEKERFVVGIGIGFIPCHIAIKKSNSTGGCGITADADAIVLIKIIK